MELKELQKDNRGSVYLLEFEGIEYLLIFTRKGYLRGGEIHDGTQTNYIIKGECLWTYNRSKTGNFTWTKHLQAGQTWCIPKGIAHMMEALTDTLMIEWREFPLENPVNYYEAMRKLVEAKRNEK